MEVKYKKSVQAINYFTEKSAGVINRMKLMKLLWLSDRLHLQMHGRPVLKDNYVAMKNGPVPSTTLDISHSTDHEYVSQYFSPKGEYDIVSNGKTDVKYFSESDLEVLDAIWDEFGSMTQFQLSDLSHEYPEWKQHEAELLKNPKTRFPFDTKDLFDVPADQIKSKAFFFAVIDAGMKEESQRIYEHTTHIKDSLSKLAKA